MGESGGRILCPRGAQTVFGDSYSWYYRCFSKGEEGHATVPSPTTSQRDFCKAQRSNDSHASIDRTVRNIRIPNPCHRAEAYLQAWIRKDSKATYPHRDQQGYSRGTREIHRYRMRCGSYQ